MKTQTSSLELSHFPVMLSEIVKISNPAKGGFFIDCTFGGGNYTKALLKFSKTEVVSFDRDSSVISIAKKLEQKFDPETTAFLYIFGKKDTGRLGGKYFQDFKKNKNNLKGFKEHGFNEGIF